LINVAALMGKVPTPLYASYVAANHGVVGLGAALRQELSIDKLDKVIRVCTLLCPTVNTPFFKHAANYTKMDPVKNPPVYEPEKVVEKILSLCTHPEDEATVGVQATAVEVAHQIAPGLIEAIATKQTNDAIVQDKELEGV
jgi:short-subunit dehydrogenase